MWDMAVLPRRGSQHTTRPVGQIFRKSMNEALVEHRDLHAHG